MPEHHSEDVSALRQRVATLEAELVARGKELGEAHQREQESQERFRQLAENLWDAVWIRAVEPGNHFPLLYANPAYERIFGIHAQDVYGPEDPWVRVLHPADREWVINELTAFICGRSDTYDVEYRVVHTDGAVRWVWARAVAARNARGEMQRVIGLTEDITQRKQMEEAREEQLRFEQLLATISAGFVDTASDQFDERMRNGLHLVGAHLAADRVGLIEVQPPLEMESTYRWLGPGVPVPPARPDPAEYPYLIGRLQRGEAVGFSRLDELPEEARIDRETFTRWGVKAHLSVPLHARGRLIATMALSCMHEREWPDVTVQRTALLGQVFANALARRRADAALSQERDRAQLYLDVAQVMLVATEPDSTVTRINRKVREVLGCREDEIVGKRWHEHFVPAHARDEVRAVFERLASGNAVSDHVRENPVLTSSGEQRLIAWRNSPLHDEDGRVIAVLCSGDDITDRRQAEIEKESLQAQLLQAQKMEAVGRLTAGIAHDFNNLLTAIIGFSELMKLRLLPADPLNELVDRVLFAAQTAAGLVQQLMAFSRQQVLQPRVLDINQAVGDMEDMLRRIIGEDISLETQLAPDLWPVKVDPVQLQQVIVNLAVNSRQAMPNGGRLNLTTTNTAVDEASAAMFTDARPGDYATLSISDTGCGISPNVLPRIFEPFFTTKPVGQGTGLGLSTVYGIVAQSGGFIGAHSQEGVGSTFTIHLPRTTQEPADTSVPEHSAVTRGKETILLVEGSPEVRDYVRNVLQPRGYEVLEAGNGQEALEVTANRSQPIHLLLTDMVLPDMTGKSLTIRAKAPRPGLRVIYMSGCADDEIDRRDALEPGTALVVKPFSSDHLARLVRQVLDAQ